MLIRPSPRPICGQQSSSWVATPFRVLLASVYSSRPPFPVIHSPVSVRLAAASGYACVGRRAPPSLDRIKARSSLRVRHSVRPSVKRRFLSHPIPTWRRKSSGEGGTAARRRRARAERTAGRNRRHFNTDAAVRDRRFGEALRVASLSVPYLELEPEQFISAHTKKLSL